MSPAVAVPLSQGEFVRRRLADLGLLDTSLKPARQEEHLILPLLRGMDATALLEELDIRLYREDRAVRFTPVHRQPAHYKDIIAGNDSIPVELFHRLPTSYDVVGKIIILKLDEELDPYRRQIGAALLEVHHNCLTVAVDRGVDGPYRIRRLDVIAGDMNLKTLHAELGVKLELDLQKLYFSPRLSRERQRIAESITDPEFIIDAFAGAGPIAIVLARNAQPGPKRILAVDINPHAIEYLRLNVMRNRCDHIVEPLEEDATAVFKKYASGGERDKPDRIIMNLPHDAFAFLPKALRAIKIGGSINYYTIIRNDEKEEHMRQIVDTGKEVGRDVIIDFTREVRNYSPSMSHFAFDLLVN